MSRFPAAPAARTTFGALRHRDYRRYCIVAYLGQIAENVEHVITYWVICIRGGGGGAAARGQARSGRGGGAEKGRSVKSAFVPSTLER